MTDDVPPFGELGDLIEQLVPVATRLVEAVRTEGPNDVRGVLLSVPKEVSDRVIELPGGTLGVLCVVLAAMVDPDAGMKSMLGWTAKMLPQEPTIEAGENTTRQRMLHVVREGRATA